MAASCVILGLTRFPSGVFALGGHTIGLGETGTGAPHPGPALGDCDGP